MMSTICIIAFIIGFTIFSSLAIKKRNIKSSSRKSLPRAPDRRKIYYKIVNDNEYHHGLQYCDGLVVDIKRFNSNPKASCVEGGIYFTTKEYLHRFFYCGKIIRPVTIPSDAKAVLDPMGDKYRADRLFFHPKNDMDFYFDNLFDKKTFQKKECSYLARYCPDHFDKWFDKEIFPKDEYYYLATHCPDQFRKWFDKKTFPEKEYWSLAKYCQKYKHVWG